MSDQVNYDRPNDRLAPTTWQQVLAVGRPRAYPAGSLLMAEGDPGATVLAVVEGEVAIVVGAHTTVATVGPGQLIGELAAVDGLPRSASVYARSAVEVRALTAAQLLAVVRSHEPTALESFVATARRARSAMDSSARDAGGAPARFVAGWMVDQLSPSSAELAADESTADGSTADGSTADGREAVAIDLDPAVVTAALGISSEFLSRALGHLESTGAVALERGRIVVLDHERLRDLAAG